MVVVFALSAADCPTAGEREREGGREVRSSTLQCISCHLLPPLAGRMRDGCVGVSPPFRAACVLFSERPGKFPQSD